MKLPILILTSFMFSCVSKPIQFDGAVIDHNGNPVEGAEVFFIGSIGGRSSGDIISIVPTDKNGVFVFLDKKEREEVDRISAVHPNGRIKTNAVNVPSTGKSGVVLSFN